MAVNVKTDEADRDGPWFETPPLKTSSLKINPDALRMLIEGKPFTTMEIRFARKKGEMFACYDFGTVLTPDSDEMVRLGTVAMLRLLLATASFRACYTGLDKAAAAALRAEVADPEGFAGLDWRRTSHGSLLELIGACRRDGWVLDTVARARPLFPSVDEKTGKFDFSESFSCRWLHTERGCMECACSAHGMHGAYEVHAWCRRLCGRLVNTGSQMGWNKHKVGAWSLRKDACEAVASRGQGKVAARVLGHRSVNGRTMDQVNRADLRCTDLGAFWTGRTAARIGAPLGCLSARRVPKAGGVRSFDDVREGPEREAAAASVEVAEAAEVAAETQRSLEARVGGAGVLDVAPRRQVEEESVRAGRGSGDGGARQGEDEAGAGEGGGEEGGDGCVPAASL